MLDGEALLDAVLNTVSDAVTVIDKDLKVIFRNEAVRQIYGPRIGEKCFEAYRARQEPCENCIILGERKTDYGKPMTSSMSPISKKQKNSFPLFTDP